MFAALVREAEAIRLHLREAILEDTTAALIRMGIMVREARREAALVGRMKDDARAALRDSLMKSGWDYREAYAIASLHELDAANARARVAAAFDVQAARVLGRFGVEPSAATTIGAALMPLGDVRSQSLLGALSREEWTPSVAQSWNEATTCCRDDALRARMNHVAQTIRREQDLQRRASSRQRATQKSVASAAQVGGNRA